MIDTRPVIQEIIDPAKNFEAKLFIKRDDLLHPFISGNKWWKLKYNFQAARQFGYQTILTFGGPFSNHIVATAAAGKVYGFKTIGIIRGERPALSNKTIEFALNNGTELHFIDRASYREKESAGFIDQLEKKFGPFYLIPEGGANLAGVKGCAEMLEGVNFSYNYICCPCGTGTTLAGLILSKKKEAKVLGFSALKGGEFLKVNVSDFLTAAEREFPNISQDQNWEIITDYHYGGYAKVKPELIKFVQAFETRTGIPLDFVYTGKMISGIYDMGAKGFFKASDKILIIHTGGLQGKQIQESTSIKDSGII